MKYKIEGVVGEKCEIDMPIYRYADVLTLLSEAIVRNGNSITQEAIVPVESGAGYSWWTKSLSIE
ncbi:RagB/SusD family nutrient uptake outer membrane protein [Bacteroides ovatus]|nr:RagB/SusD family nutrient uptake outer membrane protein [Bacteroides ovatus]